MPTPETFNLGELKTTLRVVGQLVKPQEFLDSIESHAKLAYEAGRQSVVHEIAKKIRAMENRT